MRYKKLMLFFTISLPFSILLRFLQLNFIIDTSNGFFTTDNQNYGVVSTVILFVVSLLIGFFSFTTHRRPEHAPKGNYFLSVASLFLSGVVFYDTFFAKETNVISPIFSTLKLILAVCTIIFLLAFAAKKFVSIKIFDFCYLFPCFYMLIKTIIEFTRISTIAVITDNLFLLAALCAVTVFFLQFAKLYNTVDTEKNFRKILASGLLSVFFCLLQSVPFFIFGATKGFEKIHTTVSSNIFLLALGIFILTFTLSHFAKKNSCEN